MKPMIIIHGGAWNWPDEQDAPKADALRQAVRVGWDILERGGSALDAVEQAVNVLEDDPLFDAGTGSHLNAQGVVEMDALIIDGASRNFGAVAGVQHIKNPVSLARKVLQETSHNFFIGAGAEELARTLGMPLVPGLSLVSDAELLMFRQQIKPEGGDTVGAVAIDQHGNMAAATSTGGTPGKPAGRVGDSPLFGAGGYVDNMLGGSSATGRGEQSMRVLLSHYVVDRIAHGDNAQAAAEAAMTHVRSVFSDAAVGVIVLDKDGNPGAAHVTDKMAFAWIEKNHGIQIRMRGGVG